MFVLGGSQDHIHEHLERWRGVAHSEVHNFWLERAKACFECHLPLISLFDSYVIISPSYIEFGEHPGILDLLYEIGDEG